MNRFLRQAGLFILVAIFFSAMPFAAFPADSAAADSPDSALKKSIILYVGSPVAYVNGAEKRIDPDNLEVTPAILQNTEMVPVRFIAESLGGSVQWDQKSKTATILLNGLSCKFTQGSATMLLGTGKYSLGVAVQAYKGRTFVPLDKLAELVGKKAFYDRGLIVISDRDTFDKVKDKALVSEWIAKLSYLPVVGTRDKLMSLLQQAMENGELRYGGNLKNGMLAVDNAAVQNSGAREGAVAATVESAATAAKDEAASDQSKADYSSTNVQVQGVDEGDIVKTDGSYIYQINKQRVAIIKATPAESMKVASILNYSDKNISPLEIYLQGAKLIVIGSSQAYFPIYKEENGVKKEIYPSRRLMHDSTKALIYDMTDRTNLKLLREVELEGSYVSSRMIGASLYLVANDYMDYYSIQNGEANSTPSYKDTAANKNYKDIGYNAIRYFPGTIEPNYLMVAGINLDGKETADVSTYLGAGENIYASSENLYAAVSDYSRNNAASTYQENTQIYKFAMKDGKLTYLCKGTVPGTILNQFSMDENGAFFRIATTKGNTRVTGENISKNALYVLDSMLAVTGRLEDLAPGEKIYSVRFMGDRAYVVTFKTVDPLFVLDLKDTAKPAVLGALKIPGYSDYLHPYDENHIIGFGKDTVEMKGQAYYKGMKLALFDVTNVSKPVQLFAEMIGDRGTDSELLSNHKALLFSKEKNLLAFPVTLMEVKGSSAGAKADSLEYGQFTFQGAYVYSLDLKNGFKLRGRITHLSAQDYLKAGNNWYDSDKNIKRILYIGENLYTLSNGRIKANSMSSLQEKGSVLIP
jgi:uncharacterized secreted protein with C-terminal beta-propeller domain